MLAGRLLRTKISIPASGDFTMMSSLTSWVCAFAALIAITAASAPPASVLKVASLSFLLGRCAVARQTSKGRQFESRPAAM